MTVLIARGLCIYCSPDLKVMAVLYRPFYTPRELTVVISTAVYIPPDDNVSIVLSQLYAIII